MRWRKRPSDSGATSPNRAPSKQPPLHYAQSVAERLIDLAPLVAVTLFLLVIAAAFGYLQLEESWRERQTLHHDAELVQQRMRLRMLEERELATRLAGDMTVNPMLDSRLTGQARQLLQQYPELLFIGLREHTGESAVLAAQPAMSLARALQLLASRPALPAARKTRAPSDRAPPNQPEYGLSAATYQGEPTLELVIPLAGAAVAAGDTMIAFIGLQRLLRFSVPDPIASKYAIGLIDQSGQLLSGQSVPQLNGWMQYAASARRETEAMRMELPPLDAGVMLQVQAWPTSPSLVRSGITWLAIGLSGMAIALLLANWRQGRRGRRALQALRQETAFRRAMENSMRTGMRALDLHGRIIYVNPAFCRMTGWSEAELVGQSAPFPYWPREDSQALQKLLEIELQGASDPSGNIMRVRRKDDTIFDARMYSSPLIDGTGGQTGWMASMTDITEPNRVRQQLTAARERFMAVLEALGSSVSVAPIGSVELLFANRLYRHWFGDSTDGHLRLVLKGATSTTPASDESLDQVDPFAGLPLEGVTAAPPPEHAEVYIERLDKWMEVRSRYLHWVDGRLVQMVIATDVTTRRLAEERAMVQAEHTEAINRLVTMGEMASSVAHELNQPLTAISNYCTGMIARLRRSSFGQSEMLEVLEKTAHQAQRAGQVIQHIRSFVKRSAPRRQTIAADALLDQIVDLAQLDLRRRGIGFTCQRAANLPQLFADPILIEQVLMNLIKNGADAIEVARSANPLIALAAQGSSNNDTPTIEFTVTDNGCGLSQEAMTRLYDPLFSTKSDGMGIGLSLCRSIIESHQGRISAQNLYNDQGTPTGCRFSFWIPLEVAARSGPRAGRKDLSSQTSVV